MGAASYRVKSGRDALRLSTPIAFRLPNRTTDRKVGVQYTTRDGEEVQSGTFARLKKKHYSQQNFLPQLEANSPAWWKRQFFV